MQEIDWTVAANGVAQDLSPQFNVCGDVGHTLEGWPVDPATLICTTCSGGGHTGKSANP